MQDQEKTFSPNMSTNSNLTDGPPMGVGLIPISVRITGEPLVVEPTALSLTITPPPIEGIEGIGDSASYALFYYKLERIDDGTDGQKLAVLTPLSGQGIYHIPNTITQYGNAAGAILQVNPAMLGNMHLVVIATPQGTNITDDDQKLGITIVPLLPFPPTL